MDVNLIWQFDLRYGNSDNPRNGACLLDAVSWFEYGKLGDHPECVCPIIAAFGRCINDSLSDVDRQRLKVFIPRLVGTVDKSAEQARAEFLVWKAIKVFAPIALDAADLNTHANILRNFNGSLSAAATRAARAADAATRAAAAAAACAARAADAATRAAAAADAATRAAAAACAARAADAATRAAAAAACAARAADAAAAARDAADAAADAAAARARAARAAADAAADAAVNEILDTFDDVLKIGKQAEPLNTFKFVKAMETFSNARLEPVY